MLKLLITAQIAGALLLWWTGASLVGWPAMLMALSAAAPAYWLSRRLAARDPRRWNWLVGLPPPPPPPRPVDPSAMDGDPVF